MGSRFAAVLLTASFGLAACAGTPKVPDWVNGPSQKHPSSRYLVGRGQGDTQAAARDRARADLAKIFQVAVREESRDVQTSESQTEGEKTETRAGAQVSREVATWTDQVLEGVRIADEWRDPDTSSRYALAVLDRLQAAEALRQKIARLDVATRASLEQARSAGDVLTKIGAADRAVAAQSERAELQRRLAVVDVAGVGVPPSYDLGRLKEDRAEVLRRFKVSTRAVEDPVGGLERSLAAALAGAGFLVQEGQEAPYALEGAVRVTEHPGSDGWYWVRGTLDVSLVEKAENRVRGSKHWDLKASAQHAPMARLRAMEEVDRILKADLASALVSFGSPSGR